MSKYNKSLPKPTDITLMDSKRANRKTTVTMPFGGVIPSGPSYMGWRQSSFAYSYQVQYYVKARLVPSKQLDTGAKYSKTDWKYPNTAWGSVKVDSLNKGVTVDKKNRWYRYFNFAGKSLMTKGSYDRLNIYVRVRSYNPKAKQHGPWVNKTIVVKCVPTVKVHKIVSLADGGLRVYLNTGGWKRGDSQLVMRDVRHADAAKNQNKKSFSVEVDAIGGEEASSYPYVDVSGDYFNTDFLPSEKVVFKNCVFRTCDGADASIDGTYTIDAVSATVDEPKVDIVRDEDSGTVTVKVSKREASDDWDTVKAWTNVRVRGNSVRFDPVYSSGTDDAVRTFKFMPPLDSTVELRVKISNDLGGESSYTYAVDPIPSKGRIIVSYSDGTETQPKNGRFYGSKTAAMNYETDYSTDASRAFDSELPFGRTRPVAFLGEGITNTINVKGSIDATVEEDLATAPYSTYKDWLEFQEQQGLVLLRLPDSYTYQAVTEKVSISQEDEYNETREVSLSFVEVSV